MKLEKKEVEVILTLIHRAPMKASEAKAVACVVYRLEQMLEEFNGDDQKSDE